MKISTKGRYALRIMIDLGIHGQEKCIPLKEISERQGISIKYMEQIMPMLTRVGYVKSYRGNNGGYRLSHKPEEYKVGQILRATEGSLSPISCVEDEQNKCPRYNNCMTVDFWLGMSKVINEYADSYTLADLLEKKK